MFFCFTFKNIPNYRLPSRTEISRQIFFLKIVWIHRVCQEFKESLDELSKMIIFESLWTKIWHQPLMLTPISLHFYRISFCQKNTIIRYELQMSNKSRVMQNKTQAFFQEQQEPKMLCLLDAQLFNTRYQVTGTIQHVLSTDRYQVLDTYKLFYFLIELN